MTGTRRSKIRFLNALERINHGQEVGFDEMNEFWEGFWMEFGGGCCLGCNCSVLSHQMMLREEGPGELLLSLTAPCGRGTKSMSHPWPCTLGKQGMSAGIIQAVLQHQNLWVRCEGANPAPPACPHHTLGVFPTGNGFAAEQWGTAEIPVKIPVQIRVKIPVKVVSVLGCAGRARCQTLSTRKWGAKCRG